MTPERWRLIDSRLGQPVGTDPDSTMTLPGAAAPTPGERCFPGNIGHYRVLRLVGEGGMGAVYEAEQEQPRRIVALKIIKPGLASPDLLRRFEQEAHALGRLQHPGIAQIYEAGTADTGLGAQPYFAMEFIRGPSLRDYGHQINKRQRLELMAKIADAVHHAHQRGLIHRDLKPGNILVDESGQPKILDFGVARVKRCEPPGLSRPLFRKGTVPLRRNNGPILSPLRPKRSTTSCRMTCWRRPALPDRPALTPDRTAT